MKHLAILGSSGHGKVIADAALAGDWKAAAFFDDAWPSISVTGPWKVDGTTRDLLKAKRDFDGVIVAIGNNRTRLAKQQALSAAGMNIVTIVHPAAIVSPHAEIGPGCLICAAAVVGPFARLGPACILNTGASVDHDCVLAAAVHVSPAAALGGGVEVGEATWIGIGAVVRHGVRIGADAIIGAGAAVVQDIASKVTAVGVPAQPVQTFSARGAK